MSEPENNEVVQVEKPNIRELPNKLFERLAENPREEEGCLVAETLSELVISVHTIDENLKCLKVWRDLKDCQIGTKVCAGFPLLTISAGRFPNHALREDDKGSLYEERAEVYPGNPQAWSEIGQPELSVLVSLQQNFLGLKYGVDFAPLQKMWETDLYCDGKVVI